MPQPSLWREGKDMEASAAGLATGDATQGDAAPNGDAAQAQEPSLADLSSTLDGLGTMLEQQREFLQTEPWKPAEQVQEQQQQEQAPDLSFLDENTPGYDPNTAMQQLNEWAQQVADQRVTQALTPVQQQLQDVQNERAFEDLTKEFPQLGDTKVAEETLSMAEEWAEQNLGDRSLGLKPAVVRQTYLAARALNQSQQEGTQAASAATLEGAGGASPGGATQGDQPTAETVGASWRASSLPLFGGSR